MNARLWFDGASRGNPGPMAGGAVLETGGERRVLHGDVGWGTNNQAEYEGLLLGLRGAQQAGATTVDIAGDSQLVIRQLLGEYQVKAPAIRPLYERAVALLSTFTSWTATWIPRAENAAADAAANEALDRA